MIFSRKLREANVYSLRSGLTINIYLYKMIVVSKSLVLELQWLACQLTL